jgi:hypothetical protein
MNPTTDSRGPRRILHAGAAAVSAFGAALLIAP